MTVYNFEKPKNLSDILNESINAAATLCSSEKIEDTLSLEKVLKDLQYCRKCYPQAETKICDAIFKLHDKAYYGPSDFMRHRIRVITLQDFVNKPTKNMSVLKKLLDRIALTQNPHEIFAMTQSIADHAIENYSAKKDPDLKIADRLRGLMLLLSQTPVVKKRKSNQQWLHDCAACLESAQPACKGFAKFFPIPSPTPNRRVPVILEACNVCPKIRHMYIRTHE